MTLKIKRLGGFAGVEENLASVDVAKLPKPIADQLRERVALLATLSAQRPRPVGADQFHYEIDMAEPGAQPQTLTVVDEGDPEQPAMQQLQAILELVAGKQ
jgi:hypothetical protein